MAGMVQLKFFLNLIFETMGEALYIHLTKDFSKLVSFGLLRLELFFFKIKGGVKLLQTLRDFILKIVGEWELRFS